MIKFLLTKIGKLIHSSDPNDFIFNSEFNTFKIIEEGHHTFTLAASTSNQTFYLNHGLKFTPLVSAFAKETNLAQVFSPNSANVDIWGPKTGIISTGVRFNYVASDSGTVIFNFDNTNGSTKTVDIKYYCLESL